MACLWNLQSNDSDLRGGRTLKAHAIALNDLAKNPDVGPGWTAIDAVEVAADLAVIQPTGFELQQQTVVDAECPLYASLDLLP